jgi:hypothetical protein
MDKASTGRQAGKVVVNPRSQKVGKNDVVLQGDIARKAGQLINHLKAQGKDPSGCFRGPST